MRFIYQTEVQDAWIDYNGHMQDAFYVLVFSYAVDALQDEVGFDAAYRERTGCTIYLLEDHKYFLREVKLGDQVTVETSVLGVDAKRFHLLAVMRCGDAAVAVSEMMELHVAKHPKPHGTAMPDEIRARLEAAMLSDEECVGLGRRARAIGLR